MAYWVNSTRAKKGDNCHAEAAFVDRTRHVHQAPRLYIQKNTERYGKIAAETIFGKDLAYIDWTFFISSK